MLSRLSTGPTMPTPVGIFRDVDALEYAESVTQQLAAAQAQDGPADLTGLLRSGATWTIN